MSPGRSPGGGDLIEGGRYSRVTMENQVICTNCGGPNPERAAACRHCFLTLEETEARGWFLYLGGGYAAALVLLLVLLSAPGGGPMVTNEYRLELVQPHYRRLVVASHVDSAPLFVDVQTGTQVLKKGRRSGLNGKERWDTLVNSAGKRIHLDADQVGDRLLARRIIIP